ncbi:hypothetical protein GF322_01650 [Candidatus Dependentiae bacterium]|nr:hypothetical protein [Candidatus Dependentiae bacterium]
MNFLENFSRIGFRKFNNLTNRIDWYLKVKRDKKFVTTILRFLKNNVKLRYDSPVVIIWELGGLEAILRRNLAVSFALNLRGYRTHFIICDGFSKACIQNEIGKQKTDCKLCYTSMVNCLNKFELDYSIGSSYLDESLVKKFEKIANSINISEIKHYKYLDIPVGEYALSSIIRYKKGYPADYDNYEDEAYRNYFYASLVNAYVASEVFKKKKPFGVYSSHGYYVDYAAPVFLAKKHKINSLFWSSGYANCYYYYSPKSEKKLILRNISEFEWKKRKEKDLTRVEDDKLDKFFSGRYIDKSHFDTCFFDDYENKNSLKKKLKINNNYPIACLFTHVYWDAGIDFPAMIFNDSYEWVVESIKRMNKIENVNWLVKIHPFEYRIESNYSVLDEIKKKVSFIAPHIKILDSKLTLNTQSLFNLIDIGITIWGTIGIELPLFGKPVILAGESHFSDKGFSIDVKTREEYFHILSNISSIKPLSREQIDLARKYVYSYFFERQLPANLGILDKNHNIDLNKLDKLLPGKNIYLDKICDAIISGKDVIVDKEF